MSTQRLLWPGCGTTVLPIGAACSWVGFTVFLVSVSSHILCALYKSELPPFSHFFLYDGLLTLVAIFLILLPTNLLYKTHITSSCHISSVIPLLPNTSLSKQPGSADHHGPSTMYFPVLILSGLHRIRGAWMEPQLVQRKPSEEIKRAGVL